MPLLRLPPKMVNPKGCFHPSNRPSPLQAEFIQSFDSAKRETTRCTPDPASSCQNPLAFMCSGLVQLCIVRQATTSSIMSGTTRSMSGVAQSSSIQLRLRARSRMLRKVPAPELDSNQPHMSLQNQPGAKPADSTPTCRSAKT